MFYDNSKELERITELEEQYAAAQRALDAERELSAAWAEKARQYELELEGDPQNLHGQGRTFGLRSQLATLQAQLADEQQRADRAVKDRSEVLDVKTKEGLSCSEWLMRTATAECKVKGLQAQLADRDAMILQMGEQAARLAKDGIAAKAQLRQVEGERDAHAQDVDDLIDCCINDVLVTHATPGGKPHDPDPQIRPLRDKIAGSLVELQTLRQLVEALPVVDGRMDVECGACYYIRSFVAGQYGIVCGLITEQSTAMAIKALLEYRAALAAQDAGKAVSSG